MKFRKLYFGWFFIILLIELLIALFVKDTFFRPYFGDVLVVILIYTFLRSFFKIGIKTSILVVFLFSFAIEISQWIHLIKLLNLEECIIAHWVLGSSFNWWDFLAYIIGLFFVYMVERVARVKK